MTKEDWMNRKWRPAMAWMYLIVCVIDFIVFPVLWSLLQAFFSGVVTTAWLPLTLQGGGLFHLAMGAVLGIAAWSRGKEKIVGAHYHSEDDETYYNDRGRGKKVPKQGTDEEL
ncbi:holin family protein [Candidatus Dojkabacteria bacterium]|jgi:hypothetical protein|nr:holin family protein [Candidatus Dojkabacteria bacterium]